MRFILFLFMLSTGLIAQQPNTVTAYVSLTRTIATGTAQFQIQFVEATLASTVDSAVTALASAGVAPSHLTGISVAISQGFVLTTYNFLLRVPSAEFSATRDKLIAIQRTLASSQTQGIGWSSVQVPSDDELTAALQLAMPALIAKAKGRAALLAEAMPATLGAVTQLTTPAISPDGPLATFSISATYSVTPLQ